MKPSATAGLVLLLSIFVPQAPGPDRASGQGAAVLAQASGVAERPRWSIDVRPPEAAARTIRVGPRDDLQAALNAARPGDFLALEPGAEYRGPFRLPRKAGSGWITIGSAGPGLPEPGRRVQPSHAVAMARLVSNSGAVISADPGAHHFRLVGLEIAPVTGTFLRELVDLSGKASDYAALPSDVVIDRCYLHGDPRAGSRRGIALNSKRTAVVDSYFSDFKEVGADSQAIAGWNGPGPFRIANNYLEAAGENVMFGGADPAIADLVPSDIEILGNDFVKPLRWRDSDPNYEGVAWSVKNLFELKNARRVLVDGNLFEHNWPQAQNGFAILFTVRNQDGHAPWSVVEDVTFSSNIVRHVAAGINILGHDDNQSSQQTRRIAIRNNVFADVGGSWGHGRLFQLLDGTRDIVIDHNTAFQTGGLLSGGDGRPHPGFVMQNNIVLAGTHGITGSDSAPGTAALARYFPGAIVRRNLFIGGDPKAFPVDNFFPSRIDDVGAAPARHGAPFRKLASRYSGVATDGADPGASTQLLIAVGAAGWPSNLSVPVLLFWFSFTMLGYVFLGYPLLARIRATLHPLRRRREPIEPTVTIIVTAHNEGDRIAARLKNLLDLDYPADRLEIIVGSDGSSDDTVARAREFEPAGVIVRAFDSRRGKPAMLNDLVPDASGDVIVFADARQRFNRQAIRALVANFADPAVGAVSGELVITTDADTEPTAEAGAIYWKYEKLIRSTESRGGSTVGATGAIYAIRKALFEPVPADTILDDILIPVRIARRGYHVVFEPQARAFDVAPASGYDELIRKARTIGGNFQLFSRERWLLNPKANPLWFETISHKVLRLGIPVLLATLFLSNLALLEQWPYRVTMAGQAVFYAAAVAGCGLHHSRRRIALTLPYTMCLLSWATIVGFFRFVTNRQQVTWERAAVSKSRP